MIEIKTKNIHIKLGKQHETVAPEKPTCNVIKAPEKEYTYSPLKHSLLPTPSELKHAVISVDNDPRPMLDVLRRLPVADMHLLGVQETRKEALLGYDYEISGNDDSDTEKMRRDEIFNRLTKSNIDQAIKNCVNGLLYGHSVTVPHWELDSKNQYAANFETIDFVHFTKIKNKLVMIADKNDTSVIPTIGTRTDMVEYATASSSVEALNDKKRNFKIIPLEYEKLLITINNPFEGLINNYIGGVMRPALYLTLLKHYDILDWAKFNELFGMPLRVGKSNAFSSPEAIRTLKTAVKNLGVDASAVIDDSTSIEFVDGKTTSSADGYEKFANYIEAKQSVLVLGQTLTTEVTSKFGSRAVGDVHNLVRMDKVYSDIINIQRVISKAVALDYFYNYGPPPNGNFPTFKFKTDEYKDLLLMSGVVRDLTGSGLEVSKQWAYDYFGLKEPIDEDDKFGGKSILGLM